MKPQHTMVLKSWFFVLLSSLAIFSSVKIDAKESLRPETVQTRARPSLDPLGVRFASFKFFPELTINEHYNDNIFATENDKISDFITLIKPQLIVKSDWNNHALTFRSAANIEQHFDNESENSEDFSFSGNGRLDILRNSRLTAGAGYARDHRRRSSPDDEDGLERTIFHETNVFSFYEHDLKPFAFKTGIRFSQKDFDDVASSTGIINNDDRDRDRITGELQINYEFFPNYSAFIRGAINKRNYDNLSDDLLLDRSSSGYEINIGSQIYGSGVLYGDFFIGFKEQDYDDLRLKTINGISGGGSLTWLPSGLTTVNLSSSRLIHETTVDTASGIFETKAKLDIDHELLRNLLLNLNVSFSHEDYVGIGREDKYFDVGIGANYLMNRNVNFALQYNFSNRSSSNSGSDFDRNILSLGVKFQM